MVAERERPLDDYRMAVLPADIPGLSAAFRKALPLLADEHVFFDDGPLPPELAALLPPEYSSLEGEALNWMLYV